MRDRSPLSPYALVLNGLTAGRYITIFNVNFGVMGEYIVMESPRVYRDRRGYENSTALQVKLRNLKDDNVEYRHLKDMGIIPIRADFWNPANFMIDSHHNHLLPEVANTDQAEDRNEDRVTIRLRGDTPPVEIARPVAEKRTSQFWSGTS